MDSNNNGMRGYCSEPMVSPTSRTETFVAMKLFVDNWRWAEVPFYIRTGKRMKRRVTEIVIQFKRAPLLLFQKTAVKRLEPNRLVLHLQPEEGISLNFATKIPGPLVVLQSAHVSGVADRLASSSRFSQCAARTNTGAKFTKSLSVRELRLALEFRLRGVRNN